MLYAVVFRRLGGVFQQMDQSIRRGSLEEGGGIATTLRCPSINKSRLTAGNRGQQVPWYRRFVGKTSVSLEWQVLGQQWHTPVKGCFRICTLDLE